MKTTLELIDVTESAKEVPGHVPGWRVAVSRQAWDQCVRSAVADRENEVSRIADLLYFFWGALQNTPNRSGLVAGFGFEVGHFVCDLEYSPPRPGPRRDTVLLAALACIGRSGAPQLVVLSMDEVGVPPLTQ
jgi:hypothetical protein